MDNFFTVVENLFVLQFYDALCVYDVDLTHLHGGQCGRMAFGTDTGTASRIYAALGIGEVRLEQKSVGYDTNIRTKANQSDVVELFLCPAGPTKSRLVDALGAFYIKAISDFPTFSALDAVGNWKLFAFRRLQVVLTVGVTGVENLPSICGAGPDFLAYIRNNRLCFLAA